MARDRRQHGTVIVCCIFTVCDIIRSIMDADTMHSVNITNHFILKYCFVLLLDFPSPSPSALACACLPCSGNPIMQHML